MIVQWSLWFAALTRLHIEIPSLPKLTSSTLMTEKQNITQQIQTRILCGDVEKSKVMNRGGFSSGLLGCEREELWNSKPTN
jgi:hypothetical protein